MRSALQPAVPSRRLLRYLRFQSEGIPFFSPHGHVVASTCCSHPRRSLKDATGNGLRRYSNCRPKRPEAALCVPPTFDIQTVLPKHLKRVRPGNLNLTATHNAGASRRFASTKDTRQGGEGTTEKPWGPNIDEDVETSIFTTSMTARRAKAALEPVLRCTEVDEKGDAILTDGAFKKSELIAKVQPELQESPAEASGVRSQRGCKDYGC